MDSDDFNVGELLVLHMLDSGEFDRMTIQLAIFMLTKASEDLTRYFPFYWGRDGPFSEPLFLMIESLMDNGLVNRDLPLPWPFMEPREALYERIE